MGFLGPWTLIVAVAWGAAPNPTLAEQAVAEAEDGLPERAWKLAERLLRRDPEAEDAWFALALASDRWVTLNPGRSLSKARQSRATQAWVHVSRGSDVERAGLAQLVLNPGLLAEPDPSCPPEAKLSWDEAERHFSANNLVLAQEAYQDALATCPTHPRLLTYAGDAWFVAGDFARAESMYRSALAQHPCYWPAHRFLGDSLLKRGELAEGFAHLGLAVTCNPTYATGWSSLRALLEGSVAAWNRPKFSKRAALAIAADPKDTGPTATLWRAFGEARRAARGETALAREVLAVEQVLDQHPALVSGAQQAVEGELQVWWVLAEARREGLLEPVVLSLLLDEALIPDLERALNTDLQRLLVTTFWQVGLRPSEGE
jgi:tetratricopeptide (TPR) repeat protein